MRSKLAENFADVPLAIYSKINVKKPIHESYGIKWC